jgi:hypothetical protein
MFCIFGLRCVVYPDFDVLSIQIVVFFIHADCDVLSMRIDVSCLSRLPCFVYPDCDVFYIRIVRFCLSGL